MSIIYPLHFQRRFERRWASRMIRVEPQRSPSQEISARPCGDLNMGPVSSTCLPSEILHEGHRSACGTNCETTAVSGALPRRPVK